MIASKDRARIIPYQEIIGNYSSIVWNINTGIIIPYQEIIGNYSERVHAHLCRHIIPYQEIIGNYSDLEFISTSVRLYHTKK